MAVVVQVSLWMIVHCQTRDSVHSVLKFLVLLWMDNFIIIIISLLYMFCSTWRHGISLSTLYRRSMLGPGLSLLVVQLNYPLAGINS